MSEVHAIVRQLKIDLITDTPNELVIWFDSLWDSLRVVKTDVYTSNGGEFIYYIPCDNLDDSCHVMLCYVMLCYVMLCYVMLCYVMFYRDDNDPLFLVSYKPFFRMLNKTYQFKSALEMYAVIQVLLDTKINVANPIAYSFSELKHAKVIDTLQLILKLEPFHIF